MIPQNMIESAKNRNMFEVLAMLGFSTNVENESGAYAFMVENPLRTEKTASFAINKNHNRGFDYGSMVLGKDKGLDSIELVQRVRKCNFKEAVFFILGQSTPDSFSFKGKEASKETDSPKAIEILKIKPLENRALLEYLGKRKINIRYAKACNLLFEAYFSLHGKVRRDNKPYFALAFQNKSNGYELRSETYKGCLSKDISFISHPFSRKITVFEGFIDYLSALTHYGKVKSDHAVLVLNSVSNREKALPILREYEQSLCFLDRDKGGLDCLDYFKAQGVEIRDFSQIYTGYKDFNEFLCR